ncbi:MAG: glycosyltransferase [Bacteroidetes bacterium]|jgi:glycosyltransferase involved in cell wall biosynthesis|nr:glycosyltransferase [Bacteroidota bacterium]MBX7130262.1 glycosyltransferase [Flavobacteriales bacterium]MCC6653803.1 glycosyltransferase [Flavobacteriales bacterium]HMU13472.1 glycosyltransferase [Flavobacteriales bacterium]HMZ47455.1 glycosyltransferase [Flavobacteriales bacterium]
MRIALISPNRNAWSETFIANHIAHLPGVALVLMDGHLPKRDIDGEPLLAPTLVKRVVARVRRADPQDMLRATIARRLKKHRIDVVLAEYGPTGTAMVDVCERAGIPLVTHFHGIDAFHTRILKDNADYAQLCRAASAVVVVSREMERQLSGLGCPREKLHYNCYGIEVDRFTPADVARSSKTFLAVGRFVDKKAPHLTLTAFAQAQARDPELRLVMAGDGPLWESTRSLAGALGVADAVEFPGVITQDQVAERMRTARAFVQHSVITRDNDHEGTPLSILEAMASGLPVVSTRHAGIPDVVEHEVHGLLCTEGDTRDMAEHMLRLGSEPLLAGRLGAAGRERVVREHQLGDSLRRLHAILENAARH